MVSTVQSGAKRSKRTVSKPQTEWQAAHHFLQETRAKLVERGREQQAILFLADGSYDNIDFWKGLPEGAVCIAACAESMLLIALPQPDTIGNLFCAMRYGVKHKIADFCFRRA
jgi:hypothetical protein